MLERLSRRQKFIIVMVVDGITAAVALAFSYWFIELTFDLSVSGKAWLLPTSSIVTAGSFYFFGLYQTILRFANTHFFMRVIVSSVIVSGLVASVALYSVYGQNPGFPNRVFVLFAITLSVGTACSRLIARWFFESRSGRHRTPTIIYGAGSAGHQLFSSIRYGGQYVPAAFVDDDPQQQGKSIHGIKVFSPQQIGTLIKTKKIEVVLLAMPILSQDQRANIIAKLQKYKQKYNVTIKTIPHLSDLIAGKASLDDIHNLSIEDLMARPTVPAIEDLANHCIEGQSVLVTGAGGSIGSELCRQILLRNADTIVLFEMTESALFYIEQELLERAKKYEAKTEIVPILGTILDCARLEEAIQKNKVETVFHAAAYKHVPMLETNQIEGIRNNVIGTKRVAEACASCGVNSFVVVSTDKAVRPTNLMGATKRFAELLVQTTAINNPQMNVCMVRFGNVLGSSGSVVSTFKEQIERGGPVTVTHPEMTRYFMTIPEASQLVMQAGALANNGEVFVLDMGNPVRIYDLAKNMIELSGHSVRDQEHPHGDIEIKITKPRPGEKMFEELSTSGELQKTAHPKIQQSSEHQVLVEKVLNAVNQLEAALDTRDESEAMLWLCSMVPEYVVQTDTPESVPNVEIVNTHTTPESAVIR